MQYIIELIVLAVLQLLHKLINDGTKLMYTQLKYKSTLVLEL